MDLHRAKGDGSSYCFTLARVCEAMRKRAVARRVGKPSMCTTQPTAFCLETSNAMGMNRQTLCASTAEECATQRRKLLAKKPPAVDHATECEATRNTDTFETGRPTATL